MRTPDTILAEIDTNNAKFSLLKRPGLLNNLVPVGSIEVPLPEDPARPTIEGFYDTPLGVPAIDGTLTLANLG